MEHISLHRYMRKMPSDTEVHAEHQLRADRSTCPVERIYRPTQNSVGGRNWGRNRSVRRTGPALGGWRNGSRGLTPTAGQLSESEEEHLRPRVKQLICGSLNGMRVRQSLPQTHIPQTGTRAPERHSNWELEFRDCGAIPGCGLLLTVERQIERTD